MTYRFASLLLLLAASCGCRACTDCYDYSSPVSYSAAALQSRRAGAKFAAATRTTGKAGAAAASDIAETGSAKIELTSYTLDRAPHTQIVTTEPVAAPNKEPVPTITPLPPLFAK